LRRREHPVPAERRHDYRGGGDDEYHQPDSVRDGRARPVGNDRQGNDAGNERRGCRSATCQRAPGENRWPR
jgi:hypothetical protein